ncbi:MAG TPA: penicillin-binding protein 2 [Candidatus Binatia bacterium]|nr:penicillin-binding protein 2 [Candidatus Binatia bacterium]
MSGRIDSGRPELDELRSVPRDVPPELGRRIGVAAALILAAFFAIMARLVALQVVQGPEMRSLSEHNRIRLVRVPAARGVVYDRNGELLIDNRASFDVIFVPEDAREAGAGAPAVLRTLASYLEEPEEAVVERLHAPSKRPPYEGIVMRRDLEWPGVVALETHQLDLPGVSLRAGPRRFYPYGPLAAHLLGYVGEVSESELAKATDPDLRRGDLVGKMNLERSWDAELRGKPGGQQVEVDALGRRVRVLEEVPDVPGDNLVLTIDLDLQQEAERALGDRSGAVVALDPRNGEVLVLASSPAYDPNLFARGIQPAEWRALMQNPLKPLNDRAVQGLYPPGSTFKVVMASAGLEEGAIGPKSGVYCRGGMSLGNHFFGCWRHGGHGHIVFHQAIVQSCDVFFYQLGQRLGIDTIATWSRRFGLGVPSGIRLEHEKPGIIPDTQWKLRRFKRPWVAGETMSASIGQGYVTVTPLQMAQVAATIANGGTRYRPHYVQRVVAPDGTTRQEVEPEVIGAAPIIKATTAKLLHAAMRDVVMTQGGTGHAARIRAVEVAGKTGTAQAVGLKGSNRKARASRDHAWFIAFAPVESPTIALAVLVEHAGGGGGKFAAPIAKQILEHYFTRDVGPQPRQQSDEEGHPRGRRRRAPTHRRVRGLQEAHAVRH